jgi:hypothetical protein
MHCQQNIKFFQHLSPSKYSIRAESKCHPIPKVPLFTALVLKSQEVKFRASNGITFCRNYRNIYRVKFIGRREQSAVNNSVPHNYGSLILRLSGVTVGHTRVLQDRIPVRARFFAPVQTSPGAHTASFTMDTWSFPGVNSGRGMKLTLHPLSNAVGHERVELYLYSPCGP